MKQKYNKNRVALVTGGTRGIGKAITKELLKIGVKVIATYFRGEVEAIKLREWYEEDQDRLKIMQLDLGDEEQVQYLIRRIQKDFGRLDFLINNAVEIYHIPISDLHMDKWKRTFNVNVKAPFILCRDLLLLLRENKGVIINISSTSPRTCPLGTAAYAASKSALEAFSRVLAKEEGPNGIRVNIVAPGPTYTKLLTETDKLGIAGGIRQLEKETPLKKIASANDIANGVLFLLSKEADHITGQTLSINGGLYML